MRPTSIRLSFFALLGAFALVACGSDDPAPASPYSSSPNDAVVIGDGRGGTVYARPESSGCITLASGECVKVADKCKADEHADIIVDSSGKVVAVVCYPGSAAPTPVDQQGDVELGKDNKGVVSVDGADDGVDITGNVSSSGNNVTVYGQGPAVSIIGGTVDAEGNNFAMRGVTVRENVVVKGNNATLVLCAVDGDVIVEGNNTVIAECNVGGKIDITGNNSVLMGNHVAGGIDVHGSNTACDGNTTWSDADGNGTLDATEVGAAIRCDGRK